MMYTLDPEPSPVMIITPIVLENVPRKRFCLKTRVSKGARPAQAFWMEAARVFNSHVCYIASVCTFVNFKKKKKKKTLISEYIFKIKIVFQKSNLYIKTKQNKQKKNKTKQKTKKKKKKKKKKTSVLFS